MSDAGQESPLQRFFATAAGVCPADEAGVTLGERAFLGHLNIRGNPSDQQFLDAVVFDDLNVMAYLVDGLKGQIIDRFVFVPLGRDAELLAAMGALAGRAGQFGRRNDERQEQEKLQEMKHRLAGHGDENSGVEMGARHSR